MVEMLVVEESGVEKFIDVTFGVEAWLGLRSPGL